MPLPRDEDNANKNKIRAILNRIKRKRRDMSSGKSSCTDTLTSTTSMTRGSGSDVVSAPTARRCKVHKAPIEGLSYTCPSCNSTFCLACITNVLLPEGQCMICNAPLKIDPEAQRLIDRSMDISKMSDTSMLPGETLTMISPEIWKRFEELQIADEIIEEVIDKMKHVPPEDRLKYLDAYFANTDMNDDIT